MVGFQLTFKRSLPCHTHRHTPTGSHRPSPPRLNRGQPESCSRQEAPSRLPNPAGKASAAPHSSLRRHCRHGRADRPGRRSAPVRAARPALRLPPSSAPLLPKRQIQLDSLPSPSTLPPPAPAVREASPSPAVTCRLVRRGSPSPALRGDIGDEALKDQHPRPHRPPPCCHAPAPPPPLASSHRSARRSRLVRGTPLSPCSRATSSSSSVAEVGKEGIGQCTPWTCWSPSVATKVHCLCHHLKLDVDLLPRPGHHMSTHHNPDSCRVAHGLAPDAY